MAVLTRSLSQVIVDYMPQKAPFYYGVAVYFDNGGCTLFI